jgi:hypothetical protein
MWKLKIIILGILVMVFCTGCLHVQSWPNETGFTGFVEDYLDDGLLWMFEKGIPKYYSGVSEREIDDLIDKEKTHVMLYYRPSIYSDRKYYLLHFTLWGYAARSKFSNNASSTFYHVTCYLRDIQDDNVVEYWVIKRTRGAKTPPERAFRKCLFKITVADTINSSRRVVVESDNFIDSVEVCGRTIRFPKDNLYFLANLDAYNWPKSYTNSDLVDYVVKYDKNGEPYLKKLNWFQQIWRDTDGWTYPFWRN